MKLEAARFKNAKQYWSMLKNCYTRTNKNNFKSSQFYDYFKSINDPDSAFIQADDDIFNERYLNGDLQVMFD